MDPSKTDGLNRMSAIAHVTSDALSASLLILEHLKREVYTVQEAQDFLIGNAEPVPPAPSSN